MYLLSHIHLLIPVNSLFINPRNKPRSLSSLNTHFNQLVIIRWNRRRKRVRTVKVGLRGVVKLSKLNKTNQCSTHQARPLDYHAKIECLWLAFSSIPCMVRQLTQPIASRQFRLQVINKISISMKIWHPQAKIIQVKIDVLTVLCSFHEVYLLPNAILAKLSKNKK